ncbi:MAG: AraC family transcriptional regulator [Lachnospiraceae bacterium]|nr:AraC family transcriptional regulator [Lachnospiraceae bacterium]
MLLDNHFEDLTFSEDRLINTSHTVARAYTNLVHWHPFAEILLSLTEGNEVELNFRKYEMYPNDFIISYPGDLHTIRNVSMDSFLLVQFPMELITVVPDFNRIRQLLEKTPYCRYDVNDTQIGKMVLTIKKIVNSTRDPGSFREAYNYSLLLRFFSYYGKWCLENSIDETETGNDTYYRSAKLMAEACLYISQNCTEPLTVDDVANKIGISRSYFSHLFKDYIQMTFVDYLTRERIRLAETMFTDPRKKFIDIAFECGFTSISSFNRSFRKTKGISPREFRSAMIEK